MIVTILSNGQIKGVIAALMLVLYVCAQAETSDALPEFSTFQDDKHSMAWPMLPHESLHNLAQLFYPGQADMQRLFVQKALRLNAIEYPNLTADDRFATLTPLRVPTLKSLAHARPIHKKHASHRLKMSYGIEALQGKAISGLLEQYQDLLSRNGFLKEEIAALNQKLVQLQQKLLDLKQLFNHTLQRASQPEQGKHTEMAKIETTTGAEAQLMPARPAPAAIWQDYLRTPWLLALLGFTLLGLTISWLLKKSRRKLKAFSLEQGNSGEAGEMATGTTWQEEGLPNLDMDTPQDTGMEVKEVNDKDTLLTQEVLEEARLLASVSRYEDAIAHLKAHINTHPKLSIQPWLYLLEMLKRLDMKEDFEHYAEALHQSFNVISPLWEAREMALVVPQTLEDFPHIMEKLYSCWPYDDARLYLLNLINDNRNGERGGFGQAVLDEILTLIGVLDARQDLAAV